MLSVRCASTICEIQGTTDSTEYLSKAAIAWSNLGAEVRHLKGMELDQGITANEDGPDGRRIFVTFLNRVSGEPLYERSIDSALASSRASGAAAATAK